MPLYYSTSAPSSGNKNSITRTATDFGIRDFLLQKNIINPIKYPQLPTSTNGSPRGGEPVLETMVGNGSVNVQPYLEDMGIPRYLNAVQMNIYKDDTQPDYVDIEDITKIINVNFQNSTAPANGPYNNIYQSDNIKKYGLLAKTDDAQFRKRNTIKNLYLDATKQVDIADYISLQPIDATQQIDGYLNEYGYLNFGDSGGNSGTQTADIIGSFLNGQGVGISSNGQVVPNFDIRSSLAGRVLNATGSLADTKLGQIGGQQLLLALKNNVLGNVQQEALGALNLQENITSLLKGEGLAGFRPNYRITVADDVLGTVVNILERVSGFDLPKSDLDDSGSIFSSENKNSGNIQRSNEMLRNTGKGQRNALAEQFKANLNGTSESDSPKETPFRSGYSPRYQKRNEDFLVKGEKPKLYAFSDNDGYVYNFIKPLSDGETISEISYDREKMVENYGFKGVEANTYQTQSVGPLATKFSWTTNDGKAINGIPDKFDLFNDGVNDKKSLLVKTQKLFNSRGMKNVVSSHGDMTIKNKSQIQTSVVNGGISKGSAVLAGSNFNPDGTKITPKNNENEPSSILAEKTFCRAWTPYDRYDAISKLIRNSSLNRQTISVGNFGDFELPILEEGEEKWRYNIVGSVLQDNGMPKITPYKGVNEKTTEPANVKKYMFSIENLAWCNNTYELIDTEIGPGDLLTGKKGRIMWFPPYDISFSESSSVQNESTAFIGRGEPIYTYNNTERTGNLSFKIIVDHPSIMNAFKADGASPEDEFIRSWWAGCVPTDIQWSQKLTKDEQLIFEDDKPIKQEPKKEVKKKAEVPNIIRIFFKNDVTVIDEEYENGDGLGLAIYAGEPQKPDPTAQEKPARLFPDKTDFGLNTFEGLLKVYYQKDSFPKPLIPGCNDKDFTSYFDPVYKDALKAYLTNNCPKCRATLNGAASKQGFKYSNSLLAEKRAKAIANWLKNEIGLSEDRIKIDLNETASKANTENPSYPYDKDKTEVDQKGPKVSRYAYVSFENLADDEIIEIAQPDIIKNRLVNASEAFRNRSYNEASFFEKLKKTDRFVFDKIRDQIKYFHPAFHSMTPEGFNSRLTFLLQCTRQGPSPEGTTVKNLAFGPQPVCILRIGDFYNTKIYIDNVNFDFEPLVWDLNPEGIGVQPMIANVTISFKYIGGSTLLGPINKLQNALSFNFFANTQVYDKRADTIIKGSDPKSPFELLLGKPQIDKKKVDALSTTRFSDGVDNKQVADANSQDNNAANTTPSQATDLDNLFISKITSYTGNPNSTIFPVNYNNPLNTIIGNVIELEISAKNTNQKLTKQYDVANITITNVNNPSEKYTAFANVVPISKEFCESEANPSKFVNNTCRVPLKPVQLPPYIYRISTTGSSKIDGGVFTDVDLKSLPVMQPALINTGLTIGKTYKFDFEIEGLGKLTEIRTVGTTGVILSSITSTTVVNATSATTATTVSQSDGEPKITSIFVYEQLRWGGSNEQKLTFKVGIKTENIYRESGSTREQIISEEKLKQFVNKGIKIVLTSADGISFNLEEVVKNDNSLKGFNFATGLGYQMGNDPLCNKDNPCGWRIDKINDGPYSLSIFYAGQKIQTISVKIGD